MHLHRREGLHHSSRDLKSEYIYTLSSRMQVQHYFLVIGCSLFDAWAIQLTVRTKTTAAIIMSSTNKGENA